MSSLTCPLQPDLQEPDSQKSSQQSQVEHPNTSSHDMAGYSSDTQCRASSPVLPSCHAEAQRGEECPVSLLPNSQVELPADISVSPQPNLAETQADALVRDDSSDSDHIDQCDADYSQDICNSVDMSRYSQCPSQRTPACTNPSQLSQDLKREYPCLSDNDSEDSNACEVTITDRGWQQAKRVRFSDDNDFGGEQHVDDQKAPWSLVLTRPGVNGTRPASRWGGTLTRLDTDRVCLIGGESDHNLLNEIHSLRLSDRTWGRGISACDGGESLLLAQARSWHTATKVGTKIFLFGGEVNDERNERKQTSDLLLLDVSYGLWVPVCGTGSVPSPRAGHSAALLPDGETICVFGGISGSKWLSDSYLFNVGQLSWTRCKAGSRSARPSARSYATLTTCGSYIVLFGGNDKSRSFNDVMIGVVEQKRNSVNIVWTEPLILGGAVPAPRTGHIAVACANDQGVIIAGGWDDLGAQRIFHSDVWELCIHSRAECRWRRVHPGCGRVPPPSQPGARAGAAFSEAGPGGEPAVLYGGFRDFGFLNDTFTFDLSRCVSSESRS